MLRLIKNRSRVRGNGTLVPPSPKVRVLLTLGLHFKFYWCRALLLTFCLVKHLCVNESCRNLVLKNLRVSVTVRLDRPCLLPRALSLCLCPSAMFILLVKSPSVLINARPRAFTIKLKVPLRVL